MHPPAPLLAVFALVLGACSPALDWREFQPEGSGVVARFPCKPDRHSRTIPLAVQPVRMEMLVCDAGEAKFALSYFDLAEPAKVTDALIELQSLAVGNLAAHREQSRPAAVPGMTPNPQALRLTLAGHRPDGTVLQEQVLFFTKGLRVYQAMVLGQRVSVEAADAFLDGVRFPE